jgi:hypothetical protein
MADTRDRDMNRDPITKEPGSHPIGTGVGSAGGAAAGAAIGAIGGPIGALIGGAIGAVAGGAAGHAAGEAVDPTGETEYWRSHHKPDEWNDYEPAYRYGWESRSRMHDRNWDDRLESDLRAGWDRVKGNSKLTWDKARVATRNAWNRTDNTFRAYETTDRTWRDQVRKRDYYDRNFDYDRDYRPAYRYGTFLRHQNPKRTWDATTENEFASGWDRFKGDSRLGWDRAKMAARDAWHGVERALPGDADHDGR